jgi:hypothetical protein
MWTRKDLRGLFPNESERLFNACYRQLLQWIRYGAIDTPDLESARDWMDQLMSEKVNNPRSSFYIYGN